VARSTLIVQYLRTQAWSRLDSAGPSALRVARNVVSLLDTVAYLSDMPDEAPVIAALEGAGCFRNGTFDPGPEGAVIARDWQLADEQSGGPEDLLSALAEAAARTPPGSPLAPPDHSAPASAEQSVPAPPGGGQPAPASAGQPAPAPAGQLVPPPAASADAQIATRTNPL
jgi:hypothetical protein